MSILTAALLLSALTATTIAVESAPTGQAVVIVVGAAGQPEYGRQFAEWAGLWQSACEKGDVRCITIGLENANEPTDRDRLKQTIEAEAAEKDADLWIVLIGHGTFDGKTARFNLRGPDVSADDLNLWLKPVIRPVAVINTASASAPFLVKLSGVRRVVLVATKSGFEQNYARFGGYLAAAIAESAADLDKDGQTSLLEAFLTAAAETTEFYASEGRLATEHALLDDNGDSLGTRADWFRGIRPVQKAADGAELDGYRAHQFHIVRSPIEASMSPDDRTTRDRLELQLAELRDSRNSMDEQQYFSQLETLLKQIAEIYARTQTEPQPSAP